MAGQGRGWHGDSAGHARAGKKGGETVSRDRRHMAEIGRKGGEASGGNFARDPERASKAGRKGAGIITGNPVNDQIARDADSAGTSPA